MGIQISVGAAVATTMAWLCAASALAQVNPEGGDVAGGGAWQPPTDQIAPQPQPQPAPMPMQQAPSMMAPSIAGDDHQGVVGHLGVGFFGLTEIPIMGCDTGFPPCAPQSETVTAPTVGVRYWLDPFLGLEGALGLHVHSSEEGGVEESQFGFALHAGVPLALAHSGHFVFELTPQVNFGLASGSYTQTMAMMPAKTDVSGMTIEVGAKIGAEIHFGFIDIPQLALQGTLGLMISTVSRKAETPMTPAIEQSAFDFTTIGAGEEPWDMFTGNIAAIYYL